MPINAASAHPVGRASLSGSWAPGLRARAGDGGGAAGGVGMGRGRGCWVCSRSVVRTHPGWGLPKLVSGMPGVSLGSSGVGR